jgi:hypothetical protein
MASPFSLHLCMMAKLLVLEDGQGYFKFDPTANIIEHRCSILSDSEKSERISHVLLIE